METHFLAFLGISALAIITPGPDMALIMKNALFVQRNGVFTAFGVVLGQLVWVTAASAGVAAILLASEPLFNVVKLAGAAYLVFLGVQVLVSAFRSKSSQTVSSETETSEGGASSRVAFRQGLLCNLGNPKMAVFATSLLPQFVPAAEASFLSLFVLGAVFCVMAFVWLVGYAAIIAHAGDFLRRSRIRRAIESVTGAVLITLGLRLATEHR